MLGKWLLSVGKISDRRRRHDAGPADAHGAVRVVRSSTSPSQSWQSRLRAERNPLSACENLPATRGPVGAVTGKRSSPSATHTASRTPRTTDFRPSRNAVENYQQKGTSQPLPTSITRPVLDHRCSPNFWWRSKKPPFWGGLRSGYHMSRCLWTPGTGKPHGTNRLDSPKVGRSHSGWNQSLRYCCLVEIRGI